jgi:hypothetical protein
MRHFGVGIDCDRVLLAHISFSLNIQLCHSPRKIDSTTFYQPLFVCAVYSRRVRFTQHSGST